MNITEDIVYLGVNDYDIQLFEGLFPVTRGMAYNSYVILDEKIAVVDSVEENFGEEWLASLEKALAGRKPDYLIVQHMEPDHSANITTLMERYPDTIVVGSNHAFRFMKAYFGTDYADQRIIIKEGSTLDLGSRELNFISATMVHWPEVMMTYDPKTKTLFSADAFGKFGAVEPDQPDVWMVEARRYYMGIIGNWGQYVQKTLTKLRNYDIERICALHGPVLDGDMSYYFDAYNTWSLYEPETEGVLIAYTSIYGYTEEAARSLEEKLRSRGVDVVAVDLLKVHWSQAIALAFRYSTMVLAAVTYYHKVFPIMREFIEHLTERDFKKRTVGFIESGTWGPKAAREMKLLLEDSEDITFVEPVVSMMGAVDDQITSQLDALADEIAQTLNK